MNAIVNLTAMARAETDNPQQLQRDLGKIAISSEFLLGLINDVLDMARIENNKIILTPGVYRFSELENYLEGVIRPLCEQRQLTFSYQLPSMDEAIFVDCTRFNQIFFNILSNAVKYTNPGGRVAFSMELRPTGISKAEGIFVIRDNGCGMSAAFLQRVYQPFERADNTEAYAGTGLGLAITKSIVEAMRGTILIESQLHQGTTVTVRLPLRLVEASLTEDMPDHALKETSQGGLTYEELKGAHVLIAEDNDLNLEIVQRLLSAEGVVTDSAVNGAICVEKFAASPEFFYSAILMDIRMPVMDGLEATMKIRAMPRKDAACVPIIALTANALADDADASSKAGMSAHLAKPIDPAQLYGTLVKYFRKK